MKKTRLILSAAVLLISASSFAQDTTLRTRLNEGWEAIRGDMGSVWEVLRPVIKDKPESVPLWSKVTLPHSFNCYDAVDPDVNYYEGPSWYRTSIEVANPYENGRTILEFEGAGQKTDVYVYTTKVASHVGGYDEWSVDITDAVAQVRELEDVKTRFGGRIPVSIRTDNSRDVEMIPSDMSDFNLYGGLYRYLNLVYEPATYISTLYVNPTLDEKFRKGYVGLETELCGEVTKLQSVSVRLSSAGGTVVAEKTLSKAAGTLSLDGNRLAFDGLSVKKPLLWSPSSPNLYTCTVEMDIDGRTYSRDVRFGFRTFCFEENGPFYLNGERLLLRGTHRHEDFAGVGPAVTEDMMVEEMKDIKAIGANFIRLGHYQQSSIILSLCDELGILVWEEIPWCRGGLGGPKYQEQARRMLTNMIAQHRNHVSVILWGLGNENDWPGDFQEFDKARIHDFMASLNELSHKLDPTRNTVIRRCEFCRDAVDITSPSIWAGWYNKDFHAYYDMEWKGQQMGKHHIHAEWGGDSHAGRHGEDLYEEPAAGDKTGDWSESYIVRLFDWHLMEQERMPWLTGSLFWTFRDFSTPLRPNNPIPYVNQKGVVQRDGTRKESFYVFQSYWTEEPMVHIYGHSWPERWGEKGQKRQLLVYSNCDEVELFVNGQSQGRRKRVVNDFPACGLHWDVEFAEGNNTVEAVAYKGKAQLRDSIELSYETRTWGAPAYFTLSVKSESADEMLLEAVLKDKDGVTCLDSRDFVRWGCTDRNALVKSLGTQTGSERIQLTNGRALIRVRKTSRVSHVSVSLEKEGVPAEFIVIPAVPEAGLEPARL